jgi:hypothetical protein
MEWAADLVCGAKGDDLTVIKNFLDSGGDYNNFYKLVYVDVTDKDVRKRILQHLKKEGDKVQARSLLTFLVDTWSIARSNRRMHAHIRVYSYRCVLLCTITSLHLCSKITCIHI